MRSFLVAGAVVAVVTSGTAVDAGPGVEEVGCRGETASLVGVPGEALVGTAGRDVVVTNGASSVRTLDGGDLICVTGRTPTVNAGAGDDMVDARLRVGRGSTELGPGDDRFLGGPGHDTVTAGDISPFNGTHDTGTDDIDTGRGGASVLSGLNTNEEIPFNADRITLGDTSGAPNAVTYAGRQSAGGVLSYGSGPASLSLYLDEPTGPNAWVVDAGAAHVAANGVLDVAWTGRVTTFFVSLNDPDRSSMEFRGTGAAESFSYNGFPVVVTARMGGGDDRLRVACRHLRQGTLVVGGQGRDKLDLGRTCDAADVDLARERIAEGKRVAGVEGVRLRGRHASVHGDAEDNVLRVGGCNTSVSGGRGDDVLETSSAEACNGARVDGGPGADRLIGTRNDDSLSGGAGRDRADGRQGTDTCTAETTIGCERRRSALLPGAAST